MGSLSALTGNSGHAPCPEMQNKMRVLSPGKAITQIIPPHCTGAKWGALKSYPKYEGTSSGVMCIHVSCTCMYVHMHMCNTQTHTCGMYQEERHAVYWPFTQAIVHTRVVEQEHGWK